MRAICWATVRAWRVFFSFSLFITKAANMAISPTTMNSDPKTAKAATPVPVSGIPTNRNITSPARNVQRVVCDLLELGVDMLYAPKLECAEVFTVTVVRVLESCSTSQYLPRRSACCPNLDHRRNRSISRSSS